MLPPTRIEFPGDVVWTGYWNERDEFELYDILDRGESERRLTGRRPAMKPVPRAKIVAKGGKEIA